jgi:hemerythrin
MTTSGSDPSSKPAGTSTPGEHPTGPSSRLTWRPEYSVGIEDIDAQHQELFRRAGLFIESLRRQSRQEIGVLLSFLRFYTVTHFGTEEAWMREAGYPGTNQHVKLHDRFIKDILALSKQHEKKGGPGLEPAGVSAWLEQWLTDHVTQVDTDLARHLKASGVPPPRPKEPSA